MLIIHLLCGALTLGKYFMESKISRTAIINTKLTFLKCSRPFHARFVTRSLEIVPGKMRSKQLEFYLLKHLYLKISNFIQKTFFFKINESRYIALFVVSGSIKKLFSINYVNIYLFSTFFAIDFSRKNCRVNLHCIYPDSLTLRYYKEKFI